MSLFTDSIVTQSFTKLVFFDLVEDCHGEQLVLKLLRHNSVQLAQNRSWCVISATLGLFKPCVMKRFCSDLDSQQFRQDILATSTECYHLGT